MKSHTGNHVARRTAARIEPSPLTALRDMLATAFAADLAAVAPEVCEVLRSQMQTEASPGKRSALLNGLVVLARQSAELPVATIERVQSRFDATLLSGTDELPRSSPLRAENRSLLNDANLQAEIALDNCAARLREQSSPEIFQLSARVCELLGVQSIADPANPILPRIFARALLEATASLGLDEEANLLVFKAYGPALVHIAPDLYRHANELLEERDVLPGLRARFGRPHNPRIGAAAPPAAAPIAGGDVALASLLERLLAGERPNAATIAATVAKVA